MARFDHDGDSLHYAVEGSGPPVILLHSLGGSLAMWETTFRALTPHFTVAAFDARGHGDSGGNKPFTMERFAGDAVALADRLGFARFHVVGLSMGGRAAMRIAIDSPERVAGLVVADTSAGGGAGGADRLAAVRRRIAEAGHEAFAREYTLSRLMPATPASVVDAFAGDVCRTLPDVYLTTLGAIVGEDLTGQVGAITARTLVVVGANDVSTPPDAARALAAAIPWARLEIIADANHLANLDQPEKFNAVVAGFLTAQADTASGGATPPRRVG
jgi:3-oxoadipate enol-lactonase